MKREIKFKFIVNNEGHRYITGSYTIEQLLERCATNEDILMDLEDECTSSSCNNESQNFCDCGGEFSNAVIIGKIQYIGRKDMDGNDIYEGDHVELPSGEIGIVKYSKPHYNGFEVFEINSKWFWKLDTFKLKLTGKNIYDKN